MTRTVRQVMKSDPLTVDADTSIETAAHLMRASDSTDVLVTDNGSFRGVLTDSDIVVVAIAAGRHPATIPAGDCCNQDMAWITADEPADRAAELMRRHALDRLPVLHDGQLVGTVQLGDVLNLT
ncbi:MAG TPA: CBS domain-containing protein [Acidimicrobiales bacterium]|jgi:CBS domain-containing protein